MSKVAELTKAEVDFGGVSEAKGPAGFLRGGGEMGERIRKFNWSKTPVGTFEQWPPALRTMVGILLINRFPLLLWWGPDYISFYNDAYIPILGTKHPDQALGLPVSKCWSEIWPVLKPLIDAPFTGGPSTWMEDIELEINRHGFVEETHFTVAYSPVPDETVASGIGGVLATVHEITGNIVSQRRAAAVRELGSRAIEGKTAESTCHNAATALAAHAKDVPFALLYLIDADGSAAKLAGSCGVSPGEDISPLSVNLGSEGSAPWPLAEARRLDQAQTVPDLVGRFGHAPQVKGAAPPTGAVVVPIRSSKAHEPTGFMVAGLSARLRYDQSYHDFLQLLASQVATAVANACAFVEERRRAEALAEIDRAKTVFFSNVSHELRTPLTLMLGPLEDELGRSAVRSENVLTAHRNSLRLLKLVNSLLDFSRIEAGRMRPEPVATDLAAFTGQIATTFRAAVERAGLRLLIDCKPMAREARVDRDMWEKIVFNLLSNALKYTFQGEIEVRVGETGAERNGQAGHADSQADGAYARLTVRDTGVGIPAAESKRIFERFHRVQNIRARSHEGTGIGLAMVEELTRLQGGRVSVASTEGHGTTFTVLMPLAEKGSSPDAAPAATASASPGGLSLVEEALQWLPAGDSPAPDAQEFSGAGDGQTVFPGAPFAVATRCRGTPSPRILLAEDNADMRRYIGNLLSERGYEVVAVVDGVAALEAALNSAPALILSDVMMPRLDGLGLLRAIRKDPRIQGLPVILLSARAGEEAKVEGMEAGPDDYLTKPFSARELVARVETHLELSRMRQQAALALRDREERLQEHVRRAQVLSRVATELFISDSTPKAINLLLPSVAAELGAEYYLSHVVAPSGQCLLLDASGGLSEEQTKGCARVDLGDGLCGSCALSGSPLIIQDLQHSTLAMAAPAKEIGIRAYACHPLQSGSGILGTLAFATSSRDRFELAEMDFMRTVSDLLGASMERARLLRELRLARDGAERANAAKDSFLAALSHELRTPLNPVLLLASDSAADDRLPAAVRDDFSTIARNVNIEAQLIDDLLDITKITRGKLNLEMRPLDAHAVIYDALKLVSSEITGKNIELIVKLEVGEHPIAGDPVRLQQIFWNILKNAAKFTPPRGKIILTSRSNPESGRIVIEVADTGIGLTEEELPRIFDAFAQGEHSTRAESHRFGGLGLGLAISRSLLELQGGKLTASSAGRDTGSTFRVEMPLQRTSPEKKAEKDASPRPKPRPGEGKRILLVEDHQPTLQVMGTLLRRRGYYVAAANSVAEAQRIVTDETFDLVMSDIGLPDGNGHELMKHLLEKFRLRGVALTGYGMETDIQKGRAAGFIAHLTKPINAQALDATLSAVFENSGLVPWNSLKK